jgi:tRNA (adenine22-N1)-methyltransferase
MFGGIMELSIRLDKIASMVDVCESMADIGTDHAYIPIYLIKAGVCRRAIASDINKGPVDKAVKNIKLEGLQDKIECRLGGGLSTVKQGEIQTAVIAGMGGNLIRDIIEADIEVFKELHSCVLQPVQNPEVLREYIYKQGYTIIDEELCVEEDKFYEIIKVKFGSSVKDVEPIYYEISERLIEKRHPLLVEYINRKLNKYYKIYDSLIENTENTLMRRNQLEYKINSLKEILESCR